MKRYQANDDSTVCKREVCVTMYTQAEVVLCNVSLEMGGIGRVELETPPWALASSATLHRWS